MPGGHVCEACAAGAVTSANDAEADPLYAYIDTGSMQCLNESAEHPLSHCVKPESQRLDTSKFLESDADEQLIIRIPFTEAVKIKYICVSGGSDGAAPEKLKLFVNREDIDFDNVEDTKPVQELELAPHVGHDVDYPLNYSRFQCVRTLEIFIPSNFGDDVTRMYYLGFKGKGTNNKRQIVEATYEARAIPSDHKAIEENRNVSQLGM